MEFTELLEKRRSIRDFADREVPLDLVREIIADSVKAPSAGNRQPWGFIVVNDKAWIRKISDSSRDTILRGIEKNPESPMKVYEKSLRAEGFNAFYNAPCLVLIVGPDKSPTIRMDVGLAAAYFMLAATERGLGTCWIALGAEVRDPEILTAVGLPEGQRIIAPLILGYPKAIPPMPERKAPSVLKTIP
jgi:nitroreductase